MKKISKTSNPVRLKAVGIQWDTDGEEVSLPSEIEIPEGMVDPDEISDYLSEVTGFCHTGFGIEACN